MYFRYGAMNSGKSIDVLKTEHNYKEQDKDVLLLTSAIDTREGMGVVSSRIGISSNAYVVLPEEDLVDTIENYLNETYWRYQYDESLYCILVDEAQFLSSKQVEQLAYVVDFYDIPVIAYGLKNDFQNNLFEGSRALLTHADKIEEIKTLCWYCSKKATMNLRLNDGKPVYNGEQIQIGGNESYVPVCRKHYHKPIL